MGCKCCCGGEVEFKDTSKVKNPKNPQNKISENFLSELKEFLHEYDIGFTNEINDLFLNNYASNFKSAIVISYEMNQEILDAGACVKAQKLNDDLYENFGNITYAISDYLRKNDFETCVAHPREEKINFSLLAQRANMGMIGKSGLLISPRFGPKQKIAAILVNIENLPLKQTNPHEWIRNYCENCSSCIKKCPKDALSYNENKNETVLNENMCIGCEEGCTECIKACPFYKKGYEKVYKKYMKIVEKQK